MGKYGYAWMLFYFHRIERLSVYIYLDSTYKATRTMHANRKGGKKKLRTIGDDMDKRNRCMTLENKDKNKGHKQGLQ